VASTVPVEVVTPERLVWSGEAEFVVARGADGELGVLPGHAPLITWLVDGQVRIRRPGAEELVVVARGGFLEVKPDRVTVLASSVEVPGEAAAAGDEGERATGGAAPGPV
jgi:F-type H+-transporting ATPase subunit epsilon